MPSLMLLVIRIAVRMLDYEYSYKGFGAYYWQYMLVVSMCGILMNIHIALNFCKNNWLTYTILLILFFFSIFCLLFGIEVGIHHERNEPFVFSLNNNYLFTTLFAAILLIIFEILCASLNVEIFNNMLIKIQKQSENKFVLDNLEESIIIFNQHNKIDFINNRFIYNFKHQIKRHNTI